MTRQVVASLAAVAVVVAASASGGIQNARLDPGTFAPPRWSPEVLLSIAIVWPAAIGRLVGKVWIAVLEGICGSLVPAPL